MIDFKFLPACPKTNFYIIKVSYAGKVGIDVLLESKLNAVQVASIIASYLKPNYDLEIEEVPSTKKFPSGYHESFTIDHVVSMAYRVRFTETTVVKEARIVYFDKVVSKEL